MPIKRIYRCIAISWLTYTWCIVTHSNIPGIIKVCIDNVYLHALHWISRSKISMHTYNVAMLNYRRSPSQSMYEKYAFL